MKLFAVSLFACALTGCLAPPTPDPSPEETDPPVAIPDELRMHDEGTARVEASGAEVVDSYVSDCTYIQWCNAPGARKIVCVLKPNCVDLCHTQQGYDSVISQCQNDADYVCGNHTDLSTSGCYR